MLKIKDYTNRDEHDITKAIELVLEAKKEEVEYAKDVFGVENGLNPVEGVHKLFAEKTITNQIGYEGAKTLGVVEEYRQLLKLGEKLYRLQHYQFVSDFLKYTKKKGVYIETTCKDEYLRGKQQFIVNPETIKAYEKTLEFIKSYDDILNVLGLTDKTWMYWRMNNLLDGAVVVENGKLIPNTGNFLLLDSKNNG